MIMAPNYKDVVLKIQNVEQELLRHLRLQSGLETMFQVTINTILLFYADSLTRTNQGLAAVFDQDAFVLLGISLPSSMILAVLLALNLVGLSMAQYNGVVDQRGHLYQPFGKLLILIGCCCANLTRIMSFVLYFAPSLGLFNLLHHYQGNKTKISLKNINQTKFSLAEMVDFIILDKHYVKYAHVLYLTNQSDYQSLIDIQRGQYIYFTDWYGNEAAIYEPPSIELYTLYSLTTYFVMFLGIFLMHVFTIFIIDKIWVKNIPQCATLFERTLHSILKSNFPFPYSNWLNRNGGCLDHINGKKLAQTEVFISMAINLIFNLILLFPLNILCKHYLFMII